MGFRGECEVFADMVCETVPPECLRSITEWCPNRRGTNEGMIYMVVDAPASALPSRRRSG